MNVSDEKKMTLVELSFIAFLFKKNGEIPGKYNQDKTQREYGKRRKDCFGFKGTNCINENLDRVLDLKGEAKTITTNLVK